MSPAVLRSAAGCVRSRSGLATTWNPRLFLSGVAGRTVPCKPVQKIANQFDGWTADQLVWARHIIDGKLKQKELSVQCSNPNGNEVLDQFQEVLRETQGLIDNMKEQEKRLQWHLRLQKRIACALLPTTAAVWIFAPDKKGKSSAEEEASP